MMDGFIKDLQAEGIEVDRSARALQGAARDFGGIRCGRPLGVIKAENVGQVRTVVLAANEHGSQLTIRTHGNSQSGQSVSDGGYTLDVSALNRIGRVEGDASCEAGASWRSLVEAAAPLGRVPTTLPLNLDLSVGGTVSAGGIGTSSFRYGSCATQVRTLHMVTGRGDIVECSRTRHPELFESALGGQGRCGVVTSATIAMRCTTGSVQTRYLLYESLDDCLSALLRSARHTSPEYLEAQCSSLILGLHAGEGGRKPLQRWFYGLQVTRDLDGGSVEETGVESSLNAWKQVHHDSDSLTGFLGRYDARFKQMRATGQWEQPHPWFECFLPLSSARDFIAYALDRLPPYFGDGHRVFVVRKTGLFDGVRLPRSADDIAIAFAVLPTGVPKPYLSNALEAMEALDRRAADVGATRYLSGWLGSPSKAFWRRQYGDRYAPWDAAKSTFDPRGVFCSALFPRAEN